MKTKLAYFRIDGNMLLDILHLIPNTINTLPKDAEYFGLLVGDSVEKDIIKIVIRADSLAETEINKPDDIPEIKPTWTMIKP